MLMSAKIAMLIIAIALTFRSKRLLLMTILVGADIFAPVPTNAGREVFCMDCIYIDAALGFLILLFNAEVSLAMSIICGALVAMHFAYLQAGSAQFPEYKLLVPILECVMLFLCTIDGILELHPKNKIATFIRKYFFWTFFNLHLR